MSNKFINIYLTSCAAKLPSSATSIEVLLNNYEETYLRQLWEISSRRYILTNSPTEANIIIVCDIPPKNFFESLRKNSLINQFPMKCFIVSSRDQTQPLVRGVCASARRSSLFSFRYRTGSYTLFHKIGMNDFIERYSGSAYLNHKKYLFSFDGRESHPTRTRIFKLSFSRFDIYINDTSSYGNYVGDSKESVRRSFVETMECSKFALCPRGLSPSSIRLFEAMKIGVAPIIISDDWIPPKGPDWAKFALFIKESEIIRLEEIAAKNEYRYKEMGIAAAEAYKLYFSRNVYFDFLIKQIIDINDNEIIPEILFFKARTVIYILWRYCIKIKLLFCSENTRKVLKKML